MHVHEVAIMQNPLSQRALESAEAAWILNMYWRGDHEQSLQKWSINTHRVLHLDVSKRSSADNWFTEFLNESRMGQLQDDQYNFMHGFPTLNCSRAECMEANCKNMPEYVQQKAQDTTKSWHMLWEEVQQRECIACQKERLRRKRVLGCELWGGLSQAAAKNILASKRYEESTYITEYNQPVCLSKSGSPQKPLYRVL